jgi:tRNA threonylcarbamoyladenosine biosynthesis protein TsaB
MLTSLIDDVVRQTGFTLNHLDAIAVAMGPGSYTGLRIGVSTAKGLCFALDKPMVAVNTLAAMAEQIRGFYPPDTLLCPMIDARRMEVYCAFYDTAGDERVPTKAEIIDADSFADQLVKQPVVFFGDGAAKCRTVLGQHPQAVFPEQAVTPSARTIGKLAAPMFAAGRIENPATFEPFYLKDFMTTQPRRTVV